MRTSIRVTAFLWLVAGALPAHAGDFAFSPNTNGGFGHYFWNVSIEGGAMLDDPPLFLARGATYTFDVTTSVTHPFWIKTAAGAGTANAYAGSGLSANGVTSAQTTITFAVPDDAPETLYYDCSNHTEMQGPIHMVVFRAGFE